jgi:hypothetical protein
MSIAQCLARLYPVYGHDTPSYGEFYRAIVGGRVRAEKLGRDWRVLDNLDRIRRVFGLPARPRLAV